MLTDKLSASGHSLAGRLVICRATHVPRGLSARASSTRTFEGRARSRFMANARVSDLLQALSGSWKAPPGISEADLAAAHDALRSALATEVSSHKRSTAADRSTPAGTASTTTVMPGMKPRLRSEL